MSHSRVSLWMALALYVICFAINVSADEPSLLSLLQKTSGVYIDSSKSVGDLKQTVLVTGCNHGFINQLLNFKCFADRLGMKFIVMAMDRKAHEYISKNTTMTSYFMAGGHGGQMTGVAQIFRSTDFNLITARKKEAVHSILKLGFNVIFSDTDVAMIKDPIPYMMWENVDYVHSLNYMCTVGEKWDFHKSKIEGNTGFYFVRSNANTIKLWQLAYEACPRYPKLDDQAIFWKVIRKSTDPTVLPLDKCRHFTSAKDLKDRQTSSGGEHLVSCMLDTCVFSSGMLSRVYVPEFTYERLQENLKTLNESMVAVHANYLSGNENKMQRMREYGFWLSKASTDQHMVVTEDKGCNEYVPYVIPPTTAAVKL